MIYAPTLKSSRWDSRYFKFSILVGPHHHFHTFILNGYTASSEIMYELCDSWICIINFISLQLILNHSMHHMHGHIFEIDSMQTSKIDNVWQTMINCLSPWAGMSLLFLVAHPLKPETAVILYTLYLHASTYPQSQNVSCMYSIVLYL